MTARSLLLHQLYFVSAARMSRRGCLTQGATATVGAAATPWPAAALPRPGISYSSDDGAFSFQLPAGWSISSSCSPSRGARCELSGRRSSVLASRADGEAMLEANVDLGAYGKRLADFGTLNEVARMLQASLPPTAKLTEAQAETNGRSRQSRYYRLRFAGASGGERLVKVGLQQSRLYTMSLQTDVAPSPALRAELEAIAGSYQAFPVSSMRGGLLSSTSPADVLPPSLKLL
jgi:hypothetical protein